MGLYINPPDMTKETWLINNAIDATALIGVERSWATVPEGTLPVCVVDNGAFTAAGIAFDEQEYNAFNRDDDRAKFFVLVPIDKLLEVQPQLKSYLNQ